jgi:hypothetical protein
MFEHCTIKMYGNVEFELHAFLISAQDRYELAASNPTGFIPGNTAPSTLYIYLVRLVESHMSVRSG